jgi:hypothetical protein
VTEHHRQPSWTRAVRAVRPRIAESVRRGEAVCVDCHRPIQEGQRWQVGHIVSVLRGTAAGWTESELNAFSNLGPSHASGPNQRACNQSAGAKERHARDAARKAQSKGYPQW